MTNRTLTALRTCTIIGLFSIGGAQAAETVIGSGAAQFCYEAADSSMSHRGDMQFCTDALAGVLSRNDRAATFINRGVLELRLMMVNAAQDDFNAGLAINSELGEAYVDRGATFIAQKKFAEAVVDIDRGLALGSKEPEIAYYNRAMAQEGLGNLKAAYDDYHQALIVAPDFTKASDELKRFKLVQKPTGV